LLAIGAIGKRMSEMHKFLLTIVPQLPTDFEPYGERSRDTDWGPDCSCGCKHFLPLEGELRSDWGVCANPDSPRVGLLTFEHQGCKQFEYDHRLDAEIEAMMQAQRQANPEFYERLAREKERRAKESERTEQDATGDA
jgi:hypothetical protein